MNCIDFAWALNQTNKGKGKLVTPCTTAMHSNTVVFTHILFAACTRSLEVLPTASLAVLLCSELDRKIQRLQGSPTRRCPPKAIVSRASRASQKPFLVSMSFYELCWLELEESHYSQACFLGTVQTSNSCFKIILSYLRPSPTRSSYL